jgi:glutaminase
MAEKYDLQSLTNSIQAVASPFRAYLNELHQTYQSLNEGTVANYIPELATANPDWFGICVVSVDGQVFEVGECGKTFTIESISKPFVYGMALKDRGRDYVLTKVGVAPAVEASNSIVLDGTTKRPYNPMIDAGAIATTDTIAGSGGTERLKRILEMFRHYTGREPDINVPALLSHKAAGIRHRATAHLMLNFGIVSERIEETLDLYFQHSAILINARDLAVMAATLAKGGVNPITGERAIDECYVRDVISVMFTCGMSDASGKWIYQVGIPATSGVGGGLIAVVPGKLGIGVFSPPLDENGNSLRGIKVCENLSRDFGLHLFNAAPPKHDLNAWIEGVDSIEGW